MSQGLVLAGGVSLGVPVWGIAGSRGRVGVLVGGSQRRSQRGGRRRPGGPGAHRQPGHGAGFSSPHSRSGAPGTRFSSKARAQPPALAQSCPRGGSGGRGARQAAQQHGGGSPGARGLGPPPGHLQGGTGAGAAPGPGGGSSCISCRRMSAAPEGLSGRAGGAPREQGGSSSAGGSGPLARGSPAAQGGARPAPWVRRCRSR